MILVSIYGQTYVGRLDNSFSWDTFNSGSVSANYGLQFFGKNSPSFNIASISDGNIPEYDSVSVWLLLLEAHLYQIRITRGISNSLWLQLQ